MSAGSFSVSRTGSFTSFNAAQSPAYNILTCPSTSIKQYKIKEWNLKWTPLKFQTVRVRECIAELNSKDLRHYFEGVRKLCNELEAKKEAFEVDEIVQQENLKGLASSLKQMKENLGEIKTQVTCKRVELMRAEEQMTDKLKTAAPELFEKMQGLREMQQRLSFLKFLRYFTNLRDEVRRHLRKGNYSLLLENYRKLLRIPSESLEYSMLEECRREYVVKSASLAHFLRLELRSTLSTLFSRVHFPFEEPVDSNSLKQQLLQTAQILRCLKLINIETSIISKEVAFAEILDEGISVCEEPMDLVLGEFEKRFNFHFYGDKPTNSSSKPEWFFTQLSCWAENNLEYFEQFLQPVVDEMRVHAGSSCVTDQPSAKFMFLQKLMILASDKVRDSLRLENFVQNRRQLSNLIDECVLFEREMQENFDYSGEAPVHVVSELCAVDDVLEAWIRLERDTLSAGVDALIGDEAAFEPRYLEAADVDPYLVPNFADSFVILMQSMSERYRSIPSMRIQCRFLKLQLLIVDEFRSRIVQIGQASRQSTLAKPFPQLLNALWYLTLLLNDWSDSPEFIRLQIFLQQQHQQSSSISSNEKHYKPANSSSDLNQSASINSLVRGTFDESASLYRHVWRLWVRNITDDFAESIRRKLAGYAAEKWYDWEGPPRPSELTPSLAPFLNKVRELLDRITKNISPDSVLTFVHLTNHEIWTAFDQCVVSQTAFSYRGAAQILYDATNALIPLLNNCYGKINGAGEFNIFNEKCVHVFSTLRLLSLPPPTAILLKDEVKHIPEQQLDKKLEQFEIIGMSKARVLEIFEQRCDLVAIEKLIS